MVVNGRPMKRAKKRITADLYDFLTFPAAADGGLDGPFRSNVRDFLSRHARLLPPSSILSAVSPHLLTWRMWFRIGDPKGEEESAMDNPAIVELYVVEEDVTGSRSVYCDHCRVVGWSGHPVCGKRYHFIIRNDCTPSSPCNHSSTRCGTLLHSSDLRCTTCSYEITADDFEDWAYLQLEDSTHLLHGVVHTNGYGHLLRVNGREGGSKFLAGCDIMSFWDRLCKLLRVKKVTVMDISKKHGLEYRLLHAVTADHSWYGSWGYEFGAGSFALTAEAYRKAADMLSNLPISLFFSHPRSPPRTSLQDVIGFYWSLSDCQLVTVRDLFNFLMHLLGGGGGGGGGGGANKRTQSKESSPPECKKPLQQTSYGVLCAWTKEDIELLENAMIKVLRVVGGSRWVSWRALRGATCLAVESPELLHYCLKGLGGKLTDDGMTVAVRCNAETNAIEYRLEVVADQRVSSSSLRMPTEDHVLRDLRYLYDMLLNPETMHCYKPKATRELAFESARKLLDCKQFVKDYEKYIQIASNPLALHIWCLAELVDLPKDYTAPPPELLVLSTDATVADLKSEATKAFREAYLIFQKFQVEQLLDYANVGDSTHVKLLLGSHGTVRVGVRCLGDKHRLGQFRMERGTEKWVVDCYCGAKDDDGERMLACDVCGVWRHTRCSGIGDLADVPPKFVCGKCVKNGKSFRHGGRLENITYEKWCKEMACSILSAMMEGGGGVYTEVQ